MPRGGNSHFVWAIGDVPLFWSQVFIKTEIFGVDLLSGLRTFKSIF